MRRVVAGFVLLSVLAAACKQPVKEESAARPIEPAAMAEKPLAAEPAVATPVEGANASKPEAAAKVDHAADDAKWQPCLERDYQAAVERTKSVPQYRDAFSRTYSTYTATDSRRHAVGFLVKNMPHVDLGALTPDILDENVEYALKVREQAPWKDQLSNELFYHYVLPHRMSQEPIQAWRKRIYEELWPRVAALSMAEAALEVNRYCHEYATFTANSSSRDQGPLTTMWRGLGRCEELVILYVCAARAVGLPARACYTPYWAHTDNNHAWAEVYAEGKWWFVGGAEPADGLGMAWFDGPASRAGLVISVAFGEMEECSEPVYARERGVTYINSTAVYGDTCEVFPDLPVNAPVTTVYVHVMNFGSPRVIGKSQSDLSLHLGGGDYLLTCEVGGKRLAGFARNTGVLNPDQYRAPRPDKEITGVFPQRVVKLDEATYAALTKGDGSTNWLRYPIVARRDSAKSSLKPETAPEMLNTLKAASTARKGKIGTERSSHTLNEAERKQVLAAPQKGERMLKLTDRWGPFAKDIALARIGGGGWDAEIFGRPKGSRLLELDLYELCDDKALSEVAVIGSKVVNRPYPTVEMRSAEALSSEDWLKYLANFRIDDEPLLWDGETVAIRFGREKADLRPSSWLPMPAAVQESWSRYVSEVGALPTSERVSRILTRAKSFAVAGQDRLGHIGAPIETERARQGTLRELSILLVARLRYFGVPARIATSKKWAEVLLDGEWEPVYPGEEFAADKAERKRRNAEREAKLAASQSADASFLAKPGTLYLSFTHAGRPTGTVEAFANYAVARWQDGHFETDWLEYGNDKQPTMEAAFRPGEWFVFTNRRTRRGDACFRCYPVKIESEKKATLSVETGIPYGQLDLAESELKAWPGAKVQAWKDKAPAADGETKKLSDLVNWGELLLIVAETASEPGRRMIGDVAAAANEAKAMGVNVVVLYQGSEGTEQYKAIADAAKLDAPVYTDKDGALFKEIGGQGNLGVLLLQTMPRGALRVGAQGYVQELPSTLLWTEGYNPSIAGLVRFALKGVQEGRIK